MTTEERRINAYKGIITKKDKEIARLKEEMDNLETELECCYVEIAELEIELTKKEENE